MPGFGKRARKNSDSEEEDLGMEAKREIEIEDEMDGKMEDPNKEQREILARAIKEEQLRYYHLSCFVFFIRSNFSRKKV